MIIINYKWLRQCPLSVMKLLNTGGIGLPAFVFRANDAG